MADEGGEEEVRDRYDLRGSPLQGVTMATVAFFAGLTSIVFYGVAGPGFKQALGLTGGHLGLLLSAPHISKALLRIPFGAWVDEVGGKRPFLILLGLTTLGLGGVAATLYAYPAGQLHEGFYWWFVALGFVGGAGGATFSVGVPQTSYWAPGDRQGFALGVYAGAGNIGPGLFNYAIPLLIGVWGLVGAYFGWFLFLLAVTLFYGLLAVDSYYFQLRKQEIGRDEAREVAEEAGQDVFPSGSTWGSLSAAARNPTTWVLVFLYTVSFGGGFTALTAWFPTYWNLFHGFDIALAGLFAGIFTVYGSLIRIPGGSWSDRFGGENVAVLSFLVMVAGGAILTLATGTIAAFVGMMVLGTGMGVANGAIFELVPAYVPDAVGGASGWIGGIGGAGTLVILPLLGWFTDAFGSIGYARGFVVFVVLSLVCVIVTSLLKRTGERAQPNEVVAGHREG